MTEPAPATFEDSLRELGQIVESLESGDVGLAEALSRYEKGVSLLKQCHQMLEKVERRIELLSGFDADGNPICEPFDDESSLVRSQQGAARTGRREAPGGAESRKSKEQREIDDGGSLF